MISKAELMHHRIQAAMRENVFAEDQVKYLGESEGKYWYFIGGEYKVSTDQLIDFDVVEKM